jgi:hypothetical protein
MAASQAATFNLQEFTDAGQLLVGGRLYTYAYGTTAQKIAYTDPAGTVPQTYTADGAGGQYIALNARGELPAPLYLGTGSYDLTLKRADGSTVWTRKADGVDNAVNAAVAALAAPGGSDLIGFNAVGAGAVQRSLLDRGRDKVSAFDFMTSTQIANVRNGIPTDVTAALQAAINSQPTFSGTVELPPGNYRLTAPLITAGKGLVLCGSSRYGTYLTAADGATFDMLRIAHQQCEVHHIIFRPGSAAQVPIRVYAGRANIHDNYLLAAVNNAGIGILLNDTNPDTGAFVAGAYCHSIWDNVIGDSGFAFANGIYENTTQGIQACRFIENLILSDRPIQVNKGGANTYRDNLLQSSTGTASTKAGVGITLGAGVVGEKIQGNYFELHLAMIETRSTDNTYQLFHAVANHNDNCAAAVADAGAGNYVIEDTVGKVVNYFKWSTRYTASQYGINTPSGVPTFGTDTSGNCFFGASSGASHIINRVGSTEGSVVMNWQAAGVSIGYIQDARGTGINGANTFFAMNKHSTTGRSVNAAGTVNTSGADYAEYMRKSDDCGVVVKGQIVGIDGDGKITDRWTAALAFGTKSTDPSYVGGDTWAVHLGARPEKPVQIELEYAGVIAGRKPVEPEQVGSVAKDAAAWASYCRALADWESVHAQEEADRTAYAQQVDQADADYKAAMKAWEAANAKYDIDHEAARAKVDRIAFAGQVPVNVMGAQPGQYVVPVQDGDGIKGIAKNEADMTLAEYMRAIGKVIAIEADGRARIIVKVA